MIIEIEKEEFNNISKTYDNALFCQTSNWGVLKSYTGWKALHLVYKENNEIKGAVLVLLKKMPIINYYMAYSPRGFLTDFENHDLVEKFSKELIAYLKNKHVFEYMMDPYVLLNHRDINGDIINDGFDNHKLVDKLISIGFKHTGYNIYNENLEPRWLFRVNMDGKTIDEVTKEFSKETLRRSKRKDFLGISVRELKEDEVDIFKKLMADTAKRRGFIDRPFGYYKQMYDAMHDDGILRYMTTEIDVDKCRANVNAEIEKINARITKLKRYEEQNVNQLKEEDKRLAANQKILANLDDLEKNRGKIVPLSVVCLLTYGKEAIQLLAGNDEEYMQHFSTSYIIASECIKMCKAEGYSYYNFYGITGDFNPKGESYGLYTYKKQYGGEVLELIGQFEYTINSFVKSLYDILLKVYKLTKK